MQHREHARRRGGEPERVPLRLGQRFERGEHERERGRFDAGHRGVDRDELDRRHAVDRRQHAHDVVGRIRRRGEERFDRVVGGRQQRHAVAPVLRERAARTGRAGRPGTSTRSLVSVTSVTPSSSSTCG